MEEVVFDELFPEGVYGTPPPVAVGAGAELSPPIAEDDIPVSTGTEEPVVSAGAASEVVSAAADVSWGLEAALVGPASAGAAVLTQSQTAPADFRT